MISQALMMVGLFVLLGMTKAFADARLFGIDLTPIALWMSAYDLRLWWVGGVGFDQGWPWTADFWHLMDGHLRQIVSVLIFWMGTRMRWFTPQQLVVLGVVCYWVEGFSFKFLYHMVLMQDWSWTVFFSHLP
jgi:hypothetical protein